MILFLLACAGAGKTETADTGPHEVTAYEVRWSTDPDPLVAGETGTMTLQIVDQAGRPIENLQVNHERMVHTVLVSDDWSTFQHLHHEDFAELSAEDLRTATFRFPVTLPYGGRYLVLFDYAHRDQWLQSTGELVVEGEPAQQAAPDTTPTTVVEAADLVATLTWEVPAQIGIESAWSLDLVDGDGDDVTDLVQYLGADGHAAIVDEAVSGGVHTHAWFPGVTDMAPSMDMPHQYTGPYLPFHFVFEEPGPHKMWVQLQRESVDEVYVLPFVFEVAG